jgi:TP901 family phage tail tape measure protein
MPSEQIGSAYAEVGFKVDESGLNSAKSKFTSAIGEMESKAKGVGSAIGGALKTGLEAGAVAAAGVATVGVKSFMDIESAAADAASKMDLSAIAQKNGTTVGEAFNSIKEHVIDVSRELGQLNTNAFDPTQIASALSNLAAGGFDVASASAENLSSILSLATATNYDLGGSSEMALSAMNTFGMGVEDLGHIADVYTTACGASAVGMGDLNYAMQQAGPTASVANVSFETLTACLETFSQSSIKGEKGGTALRGAINTLITPTKSLTDGLESIGLKMSDVDPRSNDFVDILAKMKSQADASGQGLAAFTKIFGAEGGLIYKLASSTDQIETFRQGLLNCNGAASQMAQLMLDNLKGSFDAALGSATDLAIGVGQDLAPTLKSALDWFSAEGAPAIREFYEAAKAGDWSKVGDMISSGIKQGWSKLKDLGGQLLGWLKGVNWGGVGDYIVQGIKAAWNELMSLGGQLVSALASTDWSSIGTALLGAISSSIDSVIDYAKGIYDYFANIDWGGVWDSLVSAFNSAIEGLSNIGSTILGYFDAIDWGTVGFKIGQAIRDAIAALADIGQKVWDYLTSADWSGAGSSITEKIKGGLAKLNEFWNEFKTGISAVDFQTVGTEIGDKIKAGLAAVAGWAKSIYDKLVSEWNAWVGTTTAEDLGKDLALTILKGAQNLGKWIYDKIESFWTSIKSNGGSLGTTIKSTFDTIFDTVVNITQIAWDFVKGFGQGILDYGKGTIGAAILSTLGNAFADFTASHPDAMKLLGLDSLGSDLIKTAEEWRSAVSQPTKTELAISEIATLVSGDMPKDKETRTLTYAITTTGEDISAIVDAIPGTKGASGTGKASGFWSGGNYMLTSSSGGIRAEDWARQMGLSGATFAGTQAKLREAQTSGAKLSAADMEKIMAAFTAGKAVYDESHKPPGEDFKEDVEEAGEGLKEDAKEAGDTEVAGAKEDAAIGVAGAKQEAAATKEAALTFRQQIWKTVSDVDQVYRNTHEAVKIGLTSAGQKIAIIGEVAQKQWQEAGGKWADGTRIATEDWISGVRISSGTLSESFGLISQKMTSAATFTKTNIETAANAINNKVISSANTWKTSAQISTDNLATKVSNVAMTLYSKGLAAADYNYNKQIAAGNWIYDKSVSAANALATAAIKIGSSTYKFSYTNPFSSLSSSSSSGSSGISSSSSSSASSTSTGVGPWGADSGLSGWGGVPKGYASGTKTTGPQMAVIGEDGSSYPEYVIPTKTKRWDLLFAAMRSYGIRGFAEGTATGSTTSGEAVDPDAMAAYFSITGLASMSKQVQRIINNLKDFFRISWGIIRSEGNTYWRLINNELTTEVTSFRDSAWQALINVRNTAISSFQEILAGAKDSFSKMWPDVSGYVDDLAEGLVSSMEDAGSSTVDAINQMVINAESSLSAWASEWADIWVQMVSDLSDAQSQISSACSSIAAQLSRISVNVNISSGGGSYGSGGSSGSSSGFQGDWNFGGDDDWLAPTGDWSDVTGSSVSTYTINTNGGGCAIGTNCASSGCPDYQQAVIASTGPLATAGLGYTGGSTVGTYSGDPANYPLPAIFSGVSFFAKGSRVDKPTQAIIGEAGPELVIPATYTRLMDWMAGQVEGLRGGGAAQRIVVEDHTEHHWYLDGKEVTDALMARVEKQLKLKGAKPVR